MHTKVLCTHNDRGGPDVTMTVGDVRPDGGVLVNLDFKAEDAISLGIKLIEEGEKALKLAGRTEDDEVRS